MTPGLENKFGFDWGGGIYLVDFDFAVQVEKLDHVIDTNFWGFMRDEALP